METVAKLKNSPLSPRKMRLMADMIRGMRADKALYVLKVHNKQMYARQLEKLLLSAIDSWEKKNPDSDAEGSELLVKKIQVDGARMLKRVQPAPQGRAYRVRKRYNHVTLVLDSAESEA